MLTKCLSMLRTGYNISSAIQKHLHNGACSDNLFPRNKEECVQQLVRSAKKEVKEKTRTQFNVLPLSPTLEGIRPAWIGTVLECTVAIVACFT
jgi:hypothetical protein